MIESHLFYGHRPLSVLIVTSLMLMAAALIGYAVGRRVSGRMADQSQVGIIQASILGMLALMLGFTFQVASIRYDTRRTLAIDEANTLGTTFLRAQTLPEPYRTRASRMLREYIDLRAQTSSLVYHEEKLAQARRNTQRVQQQVWGQAAAAARRYPNDITGLFLESLNESIDLYSSRTAWFLARVPNTILWILAIIAMAGLAITGYGFGLVGQRSWMVMALTSVIVASVIVMIVDLDRPEAGPTRVSQQSMIDLRKSLSGFESNSR